MGFSNVYDDAERARAYDGLEFPGTYYLAYRDLPMILTEHVHGKKAVDFGCGTGRSTRFLKRLGYDVVGVDVAEHMLALARSRDPEGDYRLIGDRDLSELPAHDFGLVLSAFTFDNVPTLEKKVALFSSLRHLLNVHGRIVNLVSSPDIYVHEWASFTTQAFPENRQARSGDRVRIVMLDVEDRRPVEDILWTDASYREVYARAHLVPRSTYWPLGKLDDPRVWVSETTVPPWVIYVLESNEQGLEPTGAGGSAGG